MGVRFLKTAARKLLYVLATGVVLLAIAWWAAQPGKPDAFYSAPAQHPTERGALLRTETFTREIPAGARGWRILYTTTRADNSPAIASAIVVAPEQLSSGARPVIAWGHGGTGMVAGCAPSLMAHPFGDRASGGVWALLPKLLAENWVFVGTDYIGLGTDGGHALLIGDEAARAAFDAVRAAHRINGIDLDDRVVVWGHSQGGHAALWGGIRAQEYAPDLKVMGIAAVAPPSDLSALAAAAPPSSMLGKILRKLELPFIIRSYSAAYPEISEGFYIRKGILFLVTDMTERCLGDLRTLFSLLESALLPDNILAHDLTEGPLAERLEQNSPMGPIPLPLMIAQGDHDELVPLDIQSRFVAARCAAGQRIDFRTYPEHDHVSVLASDSALVPDLIDWTRDRLTGRPASANCAP